MAPTVTAVPNLTEGKSNDTNTPTMVAMREDLAIQVLEVVKKIACEHCGKRDDEPIVLQGEDGTRSFCSAGCVASEEREEGGDLWNTMLRRRNEIVREIEKERHSRVITLIHREEMKNGRDSYITVDSSEEILHQIRSTPRNKSIDFVVHCPGGVVLPAEQIALALSEREGRVSAIVPHFAMSGATLICLAADEIIMDPYSVLGPLDPQIGDFPSPSLLRLLELKPTQFISDQMLILADLAGKALNQMKSFVISIVHGRMERERAVALSEFLTGGYMTHDTPITPKQAKSLGLNVTVGIPDKIYAYMRLHKLTTGPVLVNRVATDGQHSHRDASR